MLRTEISELMNKDGKMYEIAQKTEYNLKLTSEEKEIAEICDAWAKEIGEKGKDPECEIAAYMKRTVQEEVYNTPDELLDQIFDRGNVGEFDDVEYNKQPKNTLISYESAAGGNVDASFIDFSALNPTWKNRQVETNLSYADLRKNGFKAIASLTAFGVESLKNALFHDVFSGVDTAISGGDAKIDVTGSAMTKTAMDALSLYLTDRDVNSVAVGLTKYAQQIANMTNYTQYMSDAMKDDFNRYGLTRFYDGVKVAGISSAKKQGDGTLLIPDKRVFGIAGKIGNLDMRGDIRVLETMDNNSESVKIKIAGFSYGYAITNIDNVAKIVFSA